jgi:cysteine desulfurase
VTTAVEHPAVSSSLEYVSRRFGVTYTEVPVDGRGLVDPDRIRAALRANTVLVSVIHANNEVGTIQALADIARLAHERGILVHTDAAQSVGKVPIDVFALGVDLLTIAGHKLYGPKGMGALYIRRGTSIDPLIHGGGQERGMRAGTENVASMVGLGAAAAIAAEGLPREEARLRSLRDRLHRLLQDRVPGVQLNGHPEYRLSNTLNVSFPGASGQAILAACPRIAASTGSACHAGETEPSPILTAMGLSRERALGAVRLSVGRWTASDHVEQSAHLLAEAYRAVVSRPVLT